MCAVGLFLSLNSLTRERTDSSMHGNDASNSGSRFRLIVNNAIMTLKKTWILTFSTFSTSFLLRVQRMTFYAQNDIKIE
jgi:hypothetical protein